MLGWHIIVYKKGGKGSIWDNDTIMHWRAGLKGTAWLEKLEKERLVREVAFNGGYPIKYEGAAKDILPLATELYKESTESLSTPPNCLSEIEPNKTLLLDCLDEDCEIVVDAWDLS